MVKFLRKKIPEPGSRSRLPPNLIVYSTAVVRHVRTSRCSAERREILGAVSFGSLHASLVEPEMKTGELTFPRKGDLRRRIFHTKLRMNQWTALNMIIALNFLAR